MLRDFGVGQELLQVGIVPAVVLGFPSLHGVALDKQYDSSRVRPLRMSASND